MSRAVFRSSVDVVQIHPDKELNDVCVGATSPQKVFALDVEKPVQVILEFQEFGTTSQCSLLIHPNKYTDITEENAIWRLISPDPRKTMVIHPADENFQTGKLYILVRFIEDNGNCFFRIKVTVKHNFYAVWCTRSPGELFLKNRRKVALTNKEPVSPCDLNSNSVLQNGLMKDEQGYIPRTRNCFYIGSWCGGDYHGQGICFYDILSDEVNTSTQTLQKREAKVIQMLLLAVYERQNLPWSAQSLPDKLPWEDHLQSNMEILFDSMDYDTAHGWSIITIPPDENAMEVYLGQWSHGAKDGKGIYQWTDRAYVGTWSNGLREGTGRIEMIDGSWYCGEWHNDLRHGYGEALLVPSMQIYRGQWQNGRRQGSGTLEYPSNGAVMEGTWEDDALQPTDVKVIYPDGSSYCGLWFEGKRHGKGTYKDVRRCAITCEWVDDTQEGLGTVTFPNGVVFKGNWSGDVQIGGSYYYPSGEIYTGEWDLQELCRHGKGYCVYPNGDTYDGDWYRDMRHGKGKMIYAASGAEYDGDWQSDQRHGFGQLTDAEGTYVGQFEENVRSGEGELYTPQGSYYKGMWRNDYRSGRGIHYDAQEDVTYDGIFLHDRLHGVGSSNHHSKRECYEGTWLDGFRQGHGTLRLPNGDIIHGIWHAGVHQDDITDCCFANGDRYVGEWRDAKRHGRGTQIYARGDVFEGEWVDDQPHGRGILTNPNGEILEGEWRNGVQVDGLGALHYADGSVYEGELKKGKPHGKGQLIYPDNTIFAGDFVEGIYTL